MAAFATHSRTQMVAACGSGKTRIGADVAHRYAPDGRVLIILPTLELVSQTLKEWFAAYGASALGRVVVVCSDAEVLDEECAELRISGAKVTTRPGELAAATTGPGRVTVACRSGPPPAPGRSITVPRRHTPLSTATCSCPTAG